MLTEKETKALETTTAKIIIDAITKAHESFDVMEQYFEFVMALHARLLASFMVFITSEKKDTLFEFCDVFSNDLKNKIERILKDREIH